MNKQEIFNIVVAHARKQKVRAVIPHTNKCRYRGDGDLKCFVGALIPDEYYYPELESELASHIIENDEELEPYLKPDDLTFGQTGRFLDELQEIHDVITPEAWEDQFVIFADTHDLMVPPKES